MTKNRNVLRHEPLLRELTRNGVGEQLSKIFKDAGSLEKYEKIKNYTWQEIEEKVLCDEIFISAWTSGDNNWMRLEDYGWITAVVAWMYARYPAMDNSIRSRMETTLDAAVKMAIMKWAQRMEINGKVSQAEGQKLLLALMDMMKIVLDCVGNAFNVGLIHHHWQHAGSVVYAYSPLFAEMLKHTRLSTMPVEQFRLPHSCLELIIPSDLFPKTAQYLLDGTRSTDLSTYSAIVGELPPGSHSPYPSINVNVFTTDQRGAMPKVPSLIYFYRIALRPGSSLEEAIGKTFDMHHTHSDVTKMDPIVKARDMATAKDVFYFIASTLVYITTRDADVILGKSSKIYKDWVEELRNRKSTRKQLREVNKIRDSLETRDRRFLGMSFRIIDRHGNTHTDDAELHIARTSPITHWRVGHFHHYWMNKEGSEDKELVQKFVQPVLVNPGNPGAPEVSRIGMV